MKQPRIQWKVSMFLFIRGSIGFRSRAKEWTGPWSDGSEQWTDEAKEKLGVKDKNDTWLHIGTNFLDQKWTSPKKHPKQLGSSKMKRREPEPHVFF